MTPLLGAISLHQTGGGIAVVSDLLWRVLQEGWPGRAELVTTFDNDVHPATFAEKARFALRVASAQIAGRTDWVLFAHLGLAQIQRHIPPGLRVPYGVFLHGIEAWQPLSAGEQRALAGAALRVANSQYTAERVMAIHPAIGRVEACPLALPPGVERRNDGPVDAFVEQIGDHAVLMVGRLLRSEQYKGHDQLIAAWPAVLARVPDARLVIAGHGDDAERLKERARAHGVADRTHFLGFVSQSTLSALYERSALFALPSKGEGFGLVYLEAMRHRLPCIGSVHDAAAEVIENGVTGHLVAQDDIAGMAETIAALLLNEPKRRMMGAAGHARATSTFGFDRFQSRLRTLLAAADRQPVDRGVSHRLETRVEESVDGGR